MTPGFLEQEGAGTSWVNLLSLVTSNYCITYHQPRLPILCMHLFLSHECVVADTARIRHPTALSTTLIHALFKSVKQFTHQ